MLVESAFAAMIETVEWGSLAMYPVLFSVSIGLLFTMLRRTEWKKPGSAAKAAAGIVLLLGHLVVGVYCLYRARTGGYYWFYF